MKLLFQMKNLLIKRMIHFTQSDRSEGKCKSAEHSSLIQILDSWYSNNEGGEKEQAQAVDSLVACFQSNAENPVDLKPADSQKLKMRLAECYSFVSESINDENDKLESILGSLKKAGYSRL